VFVLVGVVPATHFVFDGLLLHAGQHFAHKHESAIRNKCFLVSVIAKSCELTVNVQ
jgi:hypothetical protein